MPVAGDIPINPKSDHFRDRIVHLRTENDRLREERDDVKQAYDNCHRKNKGLELALNATGDFQRRYETLQQELTISDSRLARLERELATSERKLLIAEEKVARLESRPEFHDASD